MRYRIKFCKTEAMRFTSHLDLFKTLERTMRRANLPLTYSQGFSPHPKMNLASALPLGYTSECEMADLWLDEDLPAEQVAEALKKASPPGIKLLKIESLPPESPKLQNMLTGAVYEVTLLQALPGLTDSIRELMLTESLPHERIQKGKRKTYDLRPLILEASLLPEDAEGSSRLRLHLKAEPSATGRPDDVLETLGVDPLATRIHRTELVFSE